MNSGADVSVEAIEFNNHDRNDDNHDIKTNCDFDNCDGNNHDDRFNSGADVCVASIGIAHHSLFVRGMMMMMEILSL